MSRIGKLPITVPQGVKIAVTDGVIHVEGPKGKLTCPTRPEVVLTIKGSEVKVLLVMSPLEPNAYQGLYQTR